MFAKKCIQQKWVVGKKNNSIKYLNFFSFLAKTDSAKEDPAKVDSTKAPNTTEFIYFSQRLISLKRYAISLVVQKLQLTNKATNWKALIKSNPMISL